MDKNKTIIEKHTIDVSEGVKKLDLVNLLLELDARAKNTNEVLKEIKEVLAGQASWSKEIDDKILQLLPKIKVYSENEAKGMIGPTKL